MTWKLDIEILELLSSRLCHDLISPVGAVNNGMELLAESPEDPETVEDAVNLASGSASQASALLQFYRAAYGQAGRRMERREADLEKLADGMARARRSTAEWPADAAWADVPGGTIKLALNLAALAVECLPRGGRLTIRLQAGGAGLPEVRAEGTSARVAEDTRTASSVTTPPHTLTPYTVHAHFTACVAADQACGIAFETPAPDVVVIRAIPDGSAVD